MKRNVKKKFVYQKRDIGTMKKRAEGNNKYDSFYENGVEVYKVQDDNCIRILPPTFDDATHYGMDLYVHYSIGADEAAYLCPEKMLGKKCPICDEMRKAHKEGDKEYANELKPKTRVLVYIIDRAKEDDGPKVWSMPPTVDSNIAALCMDKRTNEVLSIDDPEDGFDVDFERTGKGKKGTKYKGIKIARKSSLMLDDEGTLDETLDFITENPLDTILKIYSYDHIKNVFSGISDENDELEEEPEEIEEEVEEKPRFRNKRKVKEPEPEPEEEELIEDENEPLDEAPEEPVEEETKKLSARDKLRNKMKNRKAK